MKNKFLLACALLGVLTVSGCKKKEETIKTTLATPESIEVIVDKGRSYIIFDEVEGAEYYNVVINGNSITVRGNGTGKVQFDASKLIEEPKNYVIKVNAGGANYFDSAFTDEYVHNPEKQIDAPQITMDGFTLNWGKVSGANIYEIFMFTPTSQQTFKSVNNSFNFADMISTCGEYKFCVTAISQGEQTITSSPSNEITYIHTETLLTPYNSRVECDYNDSGELEELLTFTSSEGVKEFELNINNEIYTVDVNNFDYWMENPFQNVYIFRLKAYAKSKGITIDSEHLLNVKIKAKADVTQPYLNNSQFSQNVTYQMKSVLEQPEVLVQKAGSMCNLQINANSSKYLSKFAIYKNGKEFKRVDASIRNLSIPLTDVEGASIRVQSISNNNNCYDSKLSDAKFIDTNSTGTISLAQEGETVSWNSVSGVSNYLVEISNSRFRNSVEVDETSIDISTICEPGKYNIKVITIGQTAAQGELNVTCTQVMDKPSNLELDKDSANLYFAPVQNADGYVLKITHYSSQLETEVEKTIPHLFVSAPINVSKYLGEAQNYKFQLQAINLLNSHVLDSDLTAAVNFENVKTLTTPTIGVIASGDDWYLEITSPEDEADLIDKYEVWIDYIQFDNLVLQDGRIKVTEHLQNAGSHNFMVRAIAIDKQFLRNSGMASAPCEIRKQLNEVTNIRVTHIPEESKYILSFDGETMAGSYRVGIVKADDTSYEKDFFIQTTVADISKYITSNGTYKIYVQAIKRDGDKYYSDSPISGNPCTISKGTTLQKVENISVAKDISKDEINLTWNTVANSTGYKIQVYYNSGNTKTLKQTIFASQTSNPILNIGAGKYQSLAKEGSYTIEIKALGNEIYEDSVTATYVYNHVMETVGDFERNTIFANGETCTYKIDSLATLKNLLWRHYLYNNEIWRYNTFDYNLKVYCNLDLDALAQELNVSNDVLDAANKAQKMSIIATELLNQYVEPLSYTLMFKDGEQNPIICLNEQENIYIFNYTTNIEKLQKVETSNRVYNEKLEVVNKFDKRLATYTFDIDKQESLDITTTEQLFTALQYNKKPNFVGDSAVAEAVYKNARFVLRQICNDKMTEYEKVLHIYDFLTKRVAWNYEAEGQLTDINTNTNLQDLYLESVLYNSNKPNGLFSEIDESYSSSIKISGLTEFAGVTSLSQGLSKAFVVLCSIEGIDGIKVNGKLAGKDYSWNKVYIDIDNNGTKEWYAIDIGSAIRNKITLNVDEYQVSSHRYFLVMDSEIDAEQKDYYKRLGDISYVAETEYNYYEEQSYESSYNQVEYKGNMVIADGYDIKNIIKHAMIFGRGEKVVIDVDANSYLTNNTDVNNRISNACQQAVLEASFRYNVTFSIIENRYIVFVLTPVRE